MRITSLLSAACLSLSFAVAVPGAELRLLGWNVESGDAKPEDAGPAKEWRAMSSIIVREGDFPDTGETSDHRPVAVNFSLP